MMHRSLLLFLLLFSTFLVQAISLHVSPESVDTTLTEIYISDSLEKGLKTEVFRISNTDIHLIKTLDKLPIRFLISSPPASCYFVRRTYTSGKIEDDTTVCQAPLPILDFYRLYRWLWLLLFFILFLVFIRFSRLLHQEDGDMETGFSAFVKRLYYHALEQGNQIVFSTGEGIALSFQNVVGFLTFREMSAVARRAGTILPLYTSDPIVHQLALEYVDKKQLVSSIVFAGGSDLVHMLLLRREVGHLDGKSMLFMVGELSPKALFSVAPLMQDGHTMVVGSMNLDALSAVLPAATAIGVGPEIFSLLSSFRKPFIWRLFQLFTLTLFVVMIGIFIFSALAFFSGNPSWLDAILFVSGGRR